jgi:hypothetical protein
MCSVRGMTRKPPPVVAMAELIWLLGVTRRRVATLVGTEGFPEPVATLTVGRLWDYGDVVDYAKRTGRTLRPLPEVWPQAKD